MKRLCRQILKSKKLSIRDFAVVIGKMVANEPGVEFAPLYYRGLEKEKDKQLKMNRGNFDAQMQLTHQNRIDIQWWIDNIDTAFKYVSRGPPKVVLFTDSSLLGWGAKNETSGESTGGQWSAEEKQNHINILELTACFLGLKSLCANVTNTHIRVNMDNTTSCAYVTHFGGKTYELDKIA